MRARTFPIGVILTAMTEDDMESVDRLGRLYDWTAEERDHVAALVAEARDTFAAADSEQRRLAEWVLANCPGEPSQGGGVVDTVIRLITSARAEGKAAAEFGPLGDNHHNASRCPYCSPDRDADLRQARADGVEEGRGDMEHLERKWRAEERERGAPARFAAYEALVHAERRCRYHDPIGDKLGFERGLPRCESCQQPYRVNSALDAIDRYTRGSS